MAYFIHLTAEMRSPIMAYFIHLTAEMRSPIMAYFIHLTAEIAQSHNGILHTPYGRDCAVL